MIKKEYSAPEMQVIDLDMNAALLTMSTPDTMELEVDPSDPLNGDDALSPLFGELGMFY